MAEEQEINVLKESPDTWKVTVKLTDKDLGLMAGYTEAVVSGMRQMLPGVPEQVVIRYVIAALLLSVK